MSTTSERAKRTTGAACVGSLAPLAVVEARRLVFHPAVLVGLAAVFATTGIDPAALLSREALHNRLTFGFLFILPMLVPFAANLVASSARRAGADELFAALPTGPDRRSAAMCLGGTALALVSLGAGVGLWAVTREPRGLDIDRFPLAHAASLPLVYLGAVAYGVAVARWLPWPGAALISVVGLLVWVANVGGAHDPSLVITMPFVLVTNLEGPGAPGASDAWHAAYLACLVLAAAAAATLKERPRVMLAAGVLAGLTAGACTALTL